MEPWIKSFSDIECLRHILLPPETEDDLDQVRFKVWEAKHLAEKYQLATCFNFGLGLTGALLMFGVKQVCMFAVTEPELIDAYLEIDHQFNLRNYKIALDLGVDMIRPTASMNHATSIVPKCSSASSSDVLRRRLE